MEAEPYLVRVSPRRRSTMGIVREQGRLVVLVPPRMSVIQQRALIPGFVQRYLANEARRRAPATDDALVARARRLVAQHLSDLDLPAFTVSWSARQQRRWGSCTTATGEIRLSQRLRPMPDWVVDYVLLHELTHLVEHEHNPRFHALVNRYGQAARAQGFLEGWSHAHSLGLADADGEGRGHTDRPSGQHEID